MIKIISVIILFFLALFLAGCLSFSFNSGAPIKTEQLNKIQLGKTTKNEVFELIGPPMAVMASNELNPVPMPIMLDGPAHFLIQSDTFFELFSSNHQFHEYHRVDYFYYGVSRRTSYIGPFGPLETNKTKFDKLWLLVNEKTGIVEDYKFKLRKIWWSGEK